MPIQYIKTGGLDHALQHGAYVEALWEVGDNNINLTTILKVYIWPNEDVSGLSFKAEVDQWARHATDLFRWLRPIISVPSIAMDYSKHTAHWGNRTQAASVSFLTGSIYSSFLGMGVSPVILSPAEVRNSFGLKGNAKKELVITQMQARMMPEQKEFLERETIPLKRRDAHIAMGDIYDALILSRTLARRYND